MNNDDSEPSEQWSNSQGPSKIIKVALLGMLVILIIVAVLICASGWQIKDVFDCLKDFSWYTYP